MTPETALPPDHVTAWICALPPRVSRQVHRTYAVISAVNRAVTHGWTTDALAKECTRDLGTARDVGATVLARLQRAAEIGPPAPGAQFATFTKPKCGECNPARWVEDDDGRPVRRCECAT